jgi:hypothetical protein
MTSVAVGLFEQADTNAMASAMGVTYGGHHGTLGPTPVFGHRAGRDAAAAARRGAALEMTVPG